MLIVVRHGRTEANAAGLLLGRADPPLDDLGREQAAAVGGALVSSLPPGPVRVVSSPLQRARTTASAVADAWTVASGEALAVEVDERWVELDYGDFDGRPVASVPAEVWRDWRHDPDFAPPGGESLRSLRQRVDEACAHWMQVAAPDADGQRGTVVVVSHVSPVKATLGWALGMGDDVNWRAFVAPASITRIGPGPVLRSFNEQSHLDAPPPG